MTRLDAVLAQLRQALAALQAWIDRQKPVTPPQTPDLPPPAVETPVPEPSVEKRDLVAAFAKAIQQYEGYIPAGKDYRYPNGTTSWRNNNPGNLRSWPTQAGTRDGFAYFRTYDQGWAALIELITNAASGKSKVYRPEWTIAQFFETYSPSSDGNYPKLYASFVAKQLGVPVDTPIRKLLA
jgi:hypothetical protein